MRIIILSIAFLFLAFSAQSQVLKSAGVWYFLDVDSMTARPAVLPNGTELAYVVGTKTVYYWNRNTLTWTAYGSTFGRDSIYFDSSIIGSGTVSDPWGVDSALFATIAVVGDSIAAALLDYVEIADTAAMLLNYPSTTGYGIIDGGKTWRADTTSPNGLATRLFAKTLPTSILAGQVAYSNGTNLVGTSRFTIGSSLLVQSEAASNGIIATFQAESGNNRAVRIRADATGSDNFSFESSLAALNRFTINFPNLQLRSSSDIIYFHGTSSSNAGSEIFNNSTVFGGSNGTGYRTNRNQPFGLFHGGGDINTSAFNFVASNSALSSNGTTAFFNVARAGTTFMQIKGATGNLLLGTTTDVATSILTARSTNKSASPFPLHTLAESDAITGVQGNFDYETTQNGLRWHNGTRKAYALESTFARGTSTYVPHFDANGQIIEDTDIRFDGYRLMLNYTNYNNIIGRGSGREAATGTYNNVVGGDAGASLTSGVRNNFFGAAAGYTTTSGSRNNFFGENAGFRNTTGGSNNFFGQNAGFFNTTGGNNIFFGTNAGYSNTTGQRNIFIGEEAGYVGTTTSENVFLGYRAGRNNNGGTTNVFIGTQSGFTNTSGYSNFFAGNLSGFSNTTGYYNFFLGVSCGYNNTTGFNNFYSGEASGFFNTIGSLNVGIGKGAGYSNTTGSNNNAIGQSSGFAIVAGNNNNTFGQNAGRNIRNGINNIAIGYNAGYSGVATDTLGGDNNVLIGYQAGDNINLDADRNIVIGNVDLPTATGDNQMTIGNLLFGTDMTGTGTIAAGKLGVLTASPTQEFDADGDAYIRDSLRVGTLPRNTDTKDIAISDNSGWLGKRQFLITSDSIGEYNSWGYFVNNNKVAFQTSDNNSGVFFVGDTTAYASLGTYRDGAFSGNSLSVYNTSGSRYYKIDQVVQNGRSSLTYNDTQFWTVDFSESSGSVMAADSSGTIRFFQYGTGDKEAGDLGLGAPTHLAAFTTGFEQGTIVDLEIKRDTTIFLTEDIDYDFSAAVTTAQISRRYNRIIIHMTLTSGAGADKTTTLHTPDANLMQCEILIRGTDNTGTYDNEIAFGTNNAISSDGTNTSGYTLAQGQGLHVRVVYNGSAYKYIYY